VCVPRLMLLYAVVMAVRSVVEKDLSQDWVLELSLWLGNPDHSCERSYV
jgi:hypothetical protein